MGIQRNRRISPVAVRTCAGFAFIALMLTACIAGSQITTIVLSVGACGESPCQGYQIMLSPNNTYSYSIYPHRRIFTGIADFSEAARDLARSPFFRQSSPETGGRGNSSSEITIYVRYRGGARQISVMPKDDNYAAYRAFAQAVSAPVQRDVAANLAREERTLRDPQNLLTVSVFHSPLLRCLGYHAVFNRNGGVFIAYASPRRFTPKERFPAWHTAAAHFPFAGLKELVARDHVGSLYQDYPTMGADMPYFDVTLTYSTGTYTIKANEPRFWPANLRNFASVIDGVVLENLPHGRRDCTAARSPRLGGAR